jgi:hypothetical protein
MQFFEYIPTALAFTQGWLGGNSHSEAMEPVDYYARNLKTITSIYNLTVWPSAFTICSLSIMMPWNLELVLIST